MKDIKQLVSEEKESVYNIKHRAFYFAKEVVLFSNKQKFEKIHFSLLNSF